MWHIQKLSDLRREQGNTIFKSVNKDWSRSKRISVFGEACKCYQEAINEATDNDQLSSAYKNIAVVQFCLVRLRVDSK